MACLDVPPWPHIQAPQPLRLALIDRTDRVSRLIGSTTKMATIEEALQAMGFVAYSEENLKNVALVMKVASPS